FIKPIHKRNEDEFKIDLLEQSIDNINEHKGWTNDYALEDISASQSNVKFRLKYNGLPVFDINNLTLIEQNWEAKEIYEYNRSIILLNHEVNSAQKTLPSGVEIINYIEYQSLYDLNEIADIEVGYELKFLSNASDSMLLEPNWYVKTKGQWELVDTDDLNIEGGE